MSSGPFVRKKNVIVDRARIDCWETHLRFNNFDVYITVLRRSYIPPIMDTFQDVIVCSKINFPKISDEHIKNWKKNPVPGEDIGEKEALIASQEHVDNIHRTIIDSFHQKNIGYFNTVFRIMQEHRANALLFSEESLNFY